MLDTLAGEDGAEFDRTLRPQGAQGEGRGQSGGLGNHSPLPRRFGRQGRFRGAGRQVLRVALGRAPARKYCCAGCDESVFLKSE